MYYEFFVSYEAVEFHLVQWKQSHEVNRNCLKFLVFKSLTLGFPPNF